MKKQYGFIVLVVAVLLVVVAGLGVAFVAMNVNETNSNISTMSSNNAANLAQAGLQNASYLLAQGTCSSTYSSPVTLNTGQYKYSCTSYSNASSPTKITALISLLTNAATITLASVANMPPFGCITIDQETICYNSISGTTLQNIQRAQNGTTAVTHLLNAPAVQTQYILSSVGGAPTLTSPNGNVTLNQAVIVTQNTNYFAAGALNNPFVAILLKYDGTNWSVPVINYGLLDAFTGIDSNNSTGSAVASDWFGFVAYVYNYNGTSWTQGTTNILQAFQGVSCDPVNPSTCWAVGETITLFELAYNMNTSSSYNCLTTNVQTGISCNNGQCATIGNQYAYVFPIASTQPFGALFCILSSASKLTTFPVTLNGLSCTSAKNCLAADSAGNMYYYNGSSWSGPFLIESGVSLNGIHCPNTSNCIVVGNAGKIFNCSLPSPASGAFAVGNCATQATITDNLKAVHCSPTISDCLAVANGSASFYYRYTSTAGWTKVTSFAGSPTPAPPYQLNAVGGVLGSPKVVPLLTHNY